MKATRISANAPGISHVADVDVALKADGEIAIENRRRRNAARFMAAIFSWSMTSTPVVTRRGNPAQAPATPSSPLDKARLDRAPHLRAVFNVESNFLPNIDYAECHRRGIPVLSTSPVYARPVAEMVLAMAISLARRMHEADAALRIGKEFKGDNHDSFLCMENRSRWSASAISVARCCRCCARSRAN